MSFRSFSLSAALAGSIIALAASPAFSQGQSSSSSSGQAGTPPGYQRVKAPSLVDPAGPTVSLINSEPLFFMASALHACGYDEGLDES